jgi:tetratricopeptide (TPR) repeat protein
MLRLFVSLVVVFPLVSLAIPAKAQFNGSEYYNQGLELNNAGRHGEAISPLSTAINLDGKNSAAYAERGRAWNGLNEYDKAIADYNQAIALDPGNHIAYNNRGNAWQDKGENDKAIEDYNQALRFNPNYAIAYNNRGYAWNDKGEYDKAIEDYNQAIRLNPHYAIAYNNRGSAWENKGDYEKAAEDLIQAIRLDPGSAQHYNALAWLQATCPNQRYRDGRRAFQNASKACQLDGGKDWNKIDTLAAACAENGNFDAAVQWETKAIALTKDEKAKGIAGSRLELYKAKKPYRAELKKTVQTP